MGGWPKQGWGGQTADIGRGDIFIASGSGDSQAADGIATYPKVGWAVRGNEAVYTTVRDKGGGGPGGERGGGGVGGEGGVGGGGYMCSRLNGAGKSVLSSWEAAMS